MAGHGTDGRGQCEASHEYRHQGGSAALDGAVVTSTDS
jgi:hypothetical protein